MQTAPGGRRPTRRQLLFVIGPIVALVVMAYVGDALTTTWADRHPLALTLLNARSRILVLTTNQLDAWSYYLGAGVRLLISDPLFYLLGWWYGDGALLWVERRSKSFGEQVRLYERAFSKAAYPLVVAAPNPWICLFAGASGMRLPVFFALNITGTVGRLYLLRRLGEAFQNPIASVLQFFARYRLPLLVLSVALVLFVIWSDKRSEKSEIGALVELGRDPDAALDDPEAEKQAEEGGAEEEGEEEEGERGERPS
jgi:membrane protein DedA with SNARE-associated domain